MSRGSLWVARHPPVHAPNLCYGRTDVATRVAHDEAAALLADAFPSAAATNDAAAANDASGWPEIVWTSPVSRCRCVAEHFSARIGAELRVDGALHEMSMGAWDGLTWAEIEGRDGEAYARWLAEWENVAPPGGEGPRDLERRAVAWLAALDPERRHALVAHAGFVRALHVVLADRTWPEAMEIRVEHLVWSRMHWPAALDSGSVCGSACAPLLTS
ncbi:histidine phosphatase family protein [Pendulispora albinea]|uniref:Histidine phosphatase family protein n=1 Tax=Pendulispora albinea TaxID=2741071 RepID=A0ABZ2M283_9BACT